MFTKLMAKIYDQSRPTSSNMEDQAKQVRAMIDEIHADALARFSNVDKRMDEMICKNNRTKLDTRIATGLVKVKRDVLKTTTKLIQMTVDGIHESLDTKMNESVKPLQDKLDNIEGRIEQSLDSTDVLCKGVSKKLRWKC